MLCRFFRSRLGLLLLPAVLLSCKQTENSASERLVFSVETNPGSPVSAYYGEGYKTYNISTDGGAFLHTEGNPVQSDSVFTPQYLNIRISLPGASELTELLLNPNGYRVRTQIQLAGGVIIINHTNQAYLVISQEGDSLYAVRGEGIVSSGTEYFENISGLFYEESTYRIWDAAGGGTTFGQISCRYELLVDF
ncbi:MAG: hypothetical protein JXQ83_08980 [Candidatus Glassbacteria bacterium]|nr:hypothetical protein [Candidatus Glassbacteria bacterium]